MGKSIYIAIPCLGVDKELPKTLKWCLDFQSGENDIYIHVAMTDREDYFSFIKNEFSDFKNISFSFHDLENNFGVGMARYNASKFYNNQDYFLQIDSHMLFHKNWDTILIENFEKAKKTLKYNKLVLSCNLGSYWYEDKDTIRYQHRTFYSTINNEDELQGFKNVPRSSYRFPEEISYDLKTQIDSTGFAPLNKICAHMIFSDINFYLNRGLDKKFLFWEEETLQSIELLNNGFYLVYADMPSIINHKVEESLSYQDESLIKIKDGVYSWDNPSREKNQFYSERIGGTTEQWARQIDKNYIEYIENNKEKVQRYKAYSGIDISKRHFSDFDYPKTYKF